jgi:hypothetical protein
VVGTGMTGTGGSTGVGPLSTGGICSMAALTVHGKRIITQPADRITLIRVPIRVVLLATKPLGRLKEELGVEILGSSLSPMEVHFLTGRILLVGRAIVPSSLTIVGPNPGPRLAALNTCDSETTKQRGTVFNASDLRGVGRGRGQ